jgi:hypothetical protein
MKGVIREDGRLELNKGNGRLVDQICPYLRNECVPISCGLHCPMFRTNYFDPDLPTEIPHSVFVTLCNNLTIHFDKEETS